MVLLDWIAPIDLAKTFPWLGLYSSTVQQVHGVSLRYTIHFGYTLRQENWLGFPVGPKDHLFVGATVSCQWENLSQQ